MRRISLIAIVVAVALAGAGAYWWSQGPVSVAVVTPTRGAAIDAVYATGTVEPTVMLPVAPRLAGRLIALLADEGQTVRKGAVLARLDSPDLDSTVEELAARAEYARVEFARITLLVKRGVAAAAELDRTRADVEATAAALKRARAQRDFMLLTAPAAGEVIRRDGEVGQFIAVGQPVFYVSCCAPLRVTADVDEEDIPRVHVGQQVVLHADAMPGRSFDGSVSDITPKGDPVARSYRVRIRLAAPAAFKVGMTVDANLIVTARDNALLVPTRTIADGAVFLLANGRLVRQPVTTGITGLTETEVLAGISADSVLVDGPAADLVAGRRARPRAPPATGALRDRPGQH